MPEPVQTNIDGKSAEPELDFLGWAVWLGSRRRGWLRRLPGAAEVVRAGLVRLEIGSRLVFEKRKSTHGRKPWAARIRLEAPA